MVNVASARLILLKDIKQCQKDESVRVIGIWTSYNKDKEIAIIEYNENQVEVDTCHLATIAYDEGEVVQCVGEVTNDNPIRITARIVRSMNTIDLDLYEKVVELRNKHI